ncbi:putative small secreted protein [Palleronia aestuarii]|uniref:Putative small secreted protein n=1 Tax=Palleronia aestuarii TaxID=568105 RepID=A0A2W7N6Q6_9RHOB|nr:entericidin A/B family lipoprotein [Palleronia aestuarii]PZX15781.1 putative small secreted protein [Palleronia aestuarii]
MTLTTRILAILGLFVLGACETVGGAGQDIQTAGQAIERESNEVQY